MVLRPGVSSLIKVTPLLSERVAGLGALCSALKCSIYQEKRSISHFPSKPGTSCFLPNFYFLSKELRKSLKKGKKEIYIKRRK